MNKLIACFLTGLTILSYTLFAVPQPAYAGELGATTSRLTGVDNEKYEPKKVRLAYYEAEAYQEGADLGARKSGYAYEYFQKVSYYTGWEYEYVYGEWSDLYDMLLDGEIDAMGGLAYREDRVGLINYPGYEMGVESHYIYKRTGDTSIVAGQPETLSGKRVGSLKNNNKTAQLLQWAEETGTDIEVVLYEDFAARDRDLMQGTIDAIVGANSNISANHGMTPVIQLEDTPFYMCLSAARTDLLESLNEALDSINSNDPYFISNLRYKYYNNTVVSDEFSDCESEWIDSHVRLRVGYLRNYLPYSDSGEGGEARGIIHDVIPAIIGSLNLEGKLATLYTGYNSYAEMLAALQQGAIDVAFPIYGNSWYSEESKIYQSSPIISASIDLAYSGEFNEATTSLIAVNRSNEMQDTYSRITYPDATIVYYDSIDECLDAVRDGKVKSTVLNGLRTTGLLSNYKYNSVHSVITPEPSDFCIGVRQGNSGLLSLIEHGLRQLDADYAYNASYKYVGDYTQYTIRDFVNDHIALTFIIIGVIFVLIFTILILYIASSRKQRQETEKHQTELKRALVAAEQANVAKTIFLNNMSHDIRTPINAIIGFTTLLQNNVNDTAAVQDYLSKIAVSGTHLLSLINDVLDMSRIESGKVTIENRRVYLPGILKDMETIIQADVDKKNLSFTIETVDLTNEYVMTDKLRLEQVLLNLLSNSIKFTNSGGKISLRLVQMPGTLGGHASFEFRVRDTGIGMSPEFAEHVFEPFTREQTSTVSGIQGTGLGMAITKNLVDMLGGNVSVDSDQGRGSEFTVSLRCAICDGEGGMEEDGGDDIFSGIQDNNIDAAKTILSNNNKKFDGKRVLVVEDNDLNCEIITEILHQFNFATEHASDGDIAVEMVRYAEPDYYDLILMDIQMPHMNGYDAATAIRRLRDGRGRVPIIAMTANAFEEDKNQAINSGMNDHVAKPISVIQLLNAVTKVLSN